MKINNLLKFIEFTQKFRQTQRAIYAVGEKRMENDVEHSYQLAILAWYIIQSENLNLNINLAIKYALIRDLEEALTGDKPIFDQKGRTNKELLEKKARNKIIKMFPDWEEYKKLSRDYKDLANKESKFINGLDKVIPVLNIYIDGGRIWKTEDTTFEILKQNKRLKTSIDPIIQKTWLKLEKKLKAHELKLFGKLSR